MKKEISLKFSLLSFIMTCIIVLYHFKVTPLFYLNNLDNKFYILFNNIFDCLGNIAMSYFFMTTGYFMYRNLDSNNVKDKIKKRFKTLFIPYLIWNIIYFIYLTIDGYRYDIKSIFLNFIFEPFDGPLWYVFAIFILTLLSPIFIKLFKNKKISILLLTIIYVVSFYFTVINKDIIINFTNYGWYIERLIRYLPNYFTGAIVAIHFDYLVSLVKKDSIIISNILFFVTFILIILNVLDYKLIWFFNRIHPILIWNMFVIKDDIKLNILFNSSFIIYATHAFFIDIINENIFIFDIVSKVLFGLGTIGFRIIITLFIISCAVFITYIVKRSPKLSNLLTGGR